MTSTQNRRPWRALAIGVAAAAAALVAPNHALAAAPVVPNGSFEAATAGQPDQWTVSGTGDGNAAAVTTDAAHDGAHSLHVVGAGSRGVSVRSAHLPAQQNDRLTAHAWELGQSGTPAWMYLEYWDAAGHRIAERHAQPSPTSGWQPVDISLAAPPKTAYATVLVYGTSTAAGSSYYDDVTVTEQPPEAYDPALGSSSELFVDDYRVDATHDVERVVHPGTKSGILVAPDKPWESDIAYVYGSAIWDPGYHRYRMWYTAIDADGQVCACYAESRDGVHWSKPDLGLVDYHGSKDNNIVLETGPGADLGGVIRDPDDPDPARRYKMLVYQGSPRGYEAYFSPDGLHWTAYPANPVIEGADVVNVSYDRARGRFIAMTKQPFGSRAAFGSTSTDFVHWTTPELALAADDRDRAIAAGHGGEDAQIYGMPAMAYGNAYLAFPWIFEITGPGDPGTYGGGAVQPQIAASRDLIHWNRPDRDPIVPVGPAGSWDDGMTFTTNDLIVGRRRVTMYYSGWDGDHGQLGRGASIGRVTWRRDGFVSFANRGRDEGTITTKPIVFRGDAMHVNARLLRGGSLRVEVLDESGEPIPGYDLGHARPVTGDRLDAVVRWRGSNGLGDVAGRTVRLRFHLSDGDLYSFSIH